MNGIKCPQCDLVNMVNAKSCHRCQASLSDLPQTAQVSVPVEETFQAQNFGAATPATVNDIPMDNELGGKTVFWYRVYLSVLAALYFLISIGGMAAVIGSYYITNSRESEEMFVGGILYSAICLPFFLVFAAGLFFPRKPWSWIAGIVYICIGMTSCCFLPAVIPLLIFWIKPETQAYFGRR